MMKIAITGGLGFIGSSLIKFLNSKNLYDIDIYERPDALNKWQNLYDLNYKNIFFKNIQASDQHIYDAVIHLGAHTQTNLIDNIDNYINNVEYTKSILLNKNDKCKIIFSSSASVYGNPINNDFSEKIIELKPQTFYGFTKLECDKIIEKLNDPNIYSLRFFNVYGEREKYKLSNNMCSPIYRWITQDFYNNPLVIFKSKNKMERDFIYVDDVCKIIYHCLFSNNKGSIYNVGTGQSTSWEDIACKIFKLRNIIPIRGQVIYKDLPNEMQSTYQYYTKANLNKLRNQLGYKDEFYNLESGISKILSSL